MVFFLKILTALMLEFVVLSTPAAVMDIHIHDPWIRAAPPGVKVLAAYLEIINSSKKPQTLVKISSPAFEQVGIHQSVIHENMAHMEHLKELTIPPHASVVLKPGALHLMLMDAKKPLHNGDQVPMTLTFRNGEDFTFTATVRSGQTEDTEDHQPMIHSGHKHNKP